MKLNFSFDIALFTTIFTIYLFACGYFYYDGIISYYGFNQVSLGISLQDYLMRGWISGLSGLFIGLLILVIAAIFHTVSEKHLYEAFIKVIFVFFTFIFLVIFNLIFKYPLLKIWGSLLWLFNYLISSRLQGFFAAIGSFWINTGKKIIFFLKPIIKDSVDSAEKFHKFDIRENSDKIDQAIAHSGRYYIYLVCFYILFFSFVFYVISIGKDSQKLSEHIFNQTHHSQIIINDKLVSDWASEKRLNIDNPVTAKIIMCGTQKCLVAIKMSNLKYQNGSTLISNHNYLIKLIDPTSYVLLK